MSAAAFDPQDQEAVAALRVVAERAAREGGAVARRFFRTPFDIRLKADHSEVSEADEAAQAAIVSYIHAARADDAFVAEEELHGPHANLPQPRNDGVCWIIDPIDGTRNFVRGIPLYACSIGVMAGGVPIAGAVYEPQHDVMYAAGGAPGIFVNGQLVAAPARATSRPPGMNLRPVVGIPSTPAGAVATIAHAWLEQFVCRNIGSTALHLAFVAAGEFDGCLSDNARLWDIAAGYALVLAAGGRMTAPHGQALFPLDVARYDGEELAHLAAPADTYDVLRNAER